MQRTISPWITAAVALSAAGVIAITPVGAPNTEYRAVALTTLGQDLEQILAGLIDPGLAGAGAQAADTAAATDLGTGFSTALSLADQIVVVDIDPALKDYSALLGENPPNFSGAETDFNNLASDANLAANEASTAQADAAQAVAALSAPDPIQVFQGDLQTDWSQLLSDPLSTTTLTDLIATLNGAPAAAQEEIALLLDPAAVGQVTAFEDANGAAEAAAAAQQQFMEAASAAKDAATAAATEAANGADPIDSAIITSDTSQIAADASAVTTDTGVSATYATDAVNALNSATPTATLADLLAALSADLTALESMASADLTALESAASADLSALESLFSTDPGALVSTALADLDTLGSTASADLGDLGTTALADLGL